MNDEKRGKLLAAYNAAADKLEAEATSFETLPEDASDDTVAEARTALEAAEADAKRKKEHLEGFESAMRAREKYVPQASTETKIEVTEPDLYAPEGRSFMLDLYQAQIKSDPSAADRIERHHRYEVEQRATSTTTLGGIIPPQYLIDLYAKASRNGRVFADQCNQQRLPEVGMSIVVPRLTQGLAAGSQASENSAVSTQDPTESDLTVNVRTIAGYVPVSRQGLERAAYSDSILFEDLVARYWAQLDSQLINGAGSSGTHLGVLGVSGIATSTSGTATVTATWPKIADILQQINTNVGGLGFRPDKIFMHPRRWGWFLAAMDSSNRPLNPVNGPTFNVAADGQAAGYGAVGTMFGLPVYTDANIPTNLGTNTNEDRIIAISSNVVHLWERPEDPVTLSFEQQAGTSLQVQLVCYGYSAFTAGRYPGASGAVSGAGLVAPTF